MINTVSFDFESNKSLIILISVISGIVLLAIISILLYVLIISKKRLKKKVLDLDRKFEYLHALLTGQDAQYVKRLEIISRTNLLFVETHTRFAKHYKELKVRDSSIERSMNDLKNLVDDKKFKVLKTSIIEFKEPFKAFEDSVNAFDQELQSVIRPEEECRQNALTFKEELRKIKQDYYSKQAELDLVSGSFEEVFNVLDTKFEKFESLVESAHYDDANTLLPEISNIMQALESATKNLPNYCALVTVVIPEKISALENAYEQMLADKYPLHHLNIPDAIKEAREDIGVVTENIKSFNLNNVGERLEEIVLNVDSYSSAFAKERESRMIFEKECDPVYYNVVELDKNFIKLCNSLPKLKEVFQINDLQENKISEIQHAINIQDAFKRSLDAFIHSGNKEPYSKLAEKVMDLKKASDKVEELLNDFQSYLESLKTDSEDAYELVYSLYDKTRIAEKYVHLMNMEIITKKYMPIIDRAYELIDLIYECLNELPIDITSLNEYTDELNSIAIKYFDEEGDIMSDYAMMKRAENTIVITNRDRHHLSDIDRLSAHSEELFFAGEFEKSYTSAIQTLKRIRDNNEA